MRGVLHETLHFFNTLVTNVNMGTFGIKVTKVYIVGMVIMVSGMPWPLI